MWLVYVGIGSMVGFIVGFTLGAKDGDAEGYARCMEAQRVAHHERAQKAAATRRAKAIP